MGPDSEAGANRSIRARLLAIWCGCLALVLVLAVAASAQDSSPAGAAGAPKEGLPAWLENTIGTSPSLPTQAEAAKGQIEAGEVDLASRTAFRDLNATEAAAAASEAFPTLIGEPVDLSLDLAKGEKIVKYEAPNVAQLSLGDGGHAVAESALPMITEAHSGQGVAVNLALRRSGETIKPVNPLVPVEIPQDLSTGIALPESGLTLTPVDGAGDPLSGAEGAIEGAAAFYPNTQVDTDTLAKPLPQGFETQTILRSPASPEGLHFAVSAEEAPTLSEVEDGLIAVEVEGGTIATIEPVTAIDAAGNPVAVTTEIEGDELALNIEHRSGEYEYPIAVDPTVKEENNFSGVGEVGNWAFSGGVFYGGSESSAGCGCLYVQSSVGSGYEYGEGAAWAYATQGSSKIYEFDSNISSTGSKVNSLVGIAASSEEWEATSNLGTEFSAKSTTLCAVGGCSTSGGSAGNAAIYELVGIAEKSEASAKGNLNQATVKVAQEAGPTGSFNTASKEIEGKKNAIYKSQWVQSSDEAVLQYSVTDPGLGVKERNIVAAGYENWTGKLPWNYFLVPYGKNCVGIQCDQSYETTLEVDNLPQGVNTIEASARNATGATNTVTAQVKVDNTDPFSSITGLPKDGVIGLGRTLHLKFKLGDGKAPTASSGIKKDGGELLLDGKVIYGQNPECTPGPCEVTMRETDYQTVEFSPGIHTFEVIAEDNAGNVSATEFPFVVKPGPSVDIGPGKLDISDGEFSLSSSDVSAGIGLSIVRSYGSKHAPLNNVPNELTRSWALSLGGWRGISQLENGDVVLTDPKGRSFVFKHLEGGGFSPAVGYQGWSLTYSGAKPATYTLTDPSGNTTTFQKPGESGETYLPSSFTGPGGTEETTFTFETLKTGVTRPASALGPIPPGVSCAPALQRGCRELSFDYASSTTASGTAPGQWGDSNGRLRTIDLHAWDPESEEMTITPMVQYAYDSRERLRAVWDPRISPALKTTYGYESDSESSGSEYRVTSVASPGRQPWILNYGPGIKGLGAGWTGTEWLTSVSRPKASVALNSEATPPQVVSSPKLSARPIKGQVLHATHGTWSDEPAKYSYQWEVCEWESNCSGQIFGATTSTYTPTAEDVGKRLSVHVTATNAAGSTEAYVQSAKVLASETTHYVKACELSVEGGEPSTEPELGAIASALWSSHLFVADTANDRIMRFGPEGEPSEEETEEETEEERDARRLSNCFKEFEIDFGSSGSGNGQLDEPADIAVYNGEVYVLDKGNNRIEVFNEAGEYLRKFGTKGTGSGQLEDPSGLMIFKSGGETNVWVADRGNKRLDIFKSTGTYLSSFSKYTDMYGTRSVNEPIDVGVVNNLIMYTDPGYKYIEGWWMGSGSVMMDFSIIPHGTGEKESPHWMDTLTYPVENLFASDQQGNRVTEYDEKGERVDDFGGEGQIGEIGGISKGSDGHYGAEQTIFTVDTSDNRVVMWKKGFNEPGCRSEFEQEFEYLYEEGTCSNKSPVEEEVTNEEATEEKVATTAIDYEVPVSGAGAPYDMSEAQVAAWGQTEIPAYATAIFPPDAGSHPSSYKRATVYYMDAGARNVNIAAPGERIETNEYDSHENLVRNLTPANRKYAMQFGKEYTAGHSHQVDTQYTYNEAGTDLLSILSPLRSQAYGTGTGEARTHTVYEYGHNEGSSDLVTKQTESVQSLGKEDFDPRIITYSYSGQSNLGWKLEEPTAEIIDPSGLHLESRTIYDPETGAVLETTSPAHPEGNAADAEKTVYYSAGASEVEECGEHPEWVGLPCRSESSSQPETEGLPDLPITTSAYNMYEEPTITTETTGEDARIFSTEYDSAERPLTSNLVSSMGIERSPVTFVYDEETGTLVDVHDETKGLVSEYNSLGQLISYTDADGSTSTYNYDIDGRLHESYDGKGTQTHSYDTTTGDLTKLEDTGAGTFTATYNADGSLATESLPNGMQVSHDYDATGDERAVVYTKTTHCSGECMWYGNVTTRGVKDSIRSEVTARLLGGSTLAYDHGEYTYDKEGRLTKSFTGPWVEPHGKSECTTSYGYDDNTNLTSQYGYCWDLEAEKKSETNVSNSFDEANRVIDETTVYSPFGEINELSPTGVGGNILAATYYADGTTATLSEGLTSVAYGLDPLGRQRQIVISGAEGESESVAHFSASSDSPSWTSDGGEGWTRYISSIGSGLVAIQSSSGETKLQISSLHGDIVGSMPLSELATEPEFASGERSPYGAPQGVSSEESEEESSAGFEKYSWLGAARRSTDLPSGVISMGARTYVPQAGRFLQPDPIPGGSPSAYAYTWGDPIGQADLSGEYTPSFPTWLKNMIGTSPAMPPPPPPAWEAEEEAEEVAQASGGHKGAGRGGARVLLRAARNPFNPPSLQECAKHPRMKGCHVICNHGGGKCPPPPKIHHGGHDELPCELLPGESPPAMEKPECPHDPSLPVCGIFCGPGIIERAPIALVEGGPPGPGRSRQEGAGASLVV